MSQSGAKLVVGAREELQSAEHHLLVWVKGFPHFVLLLLVRVALRMLEHDNVRTDLLETKE